MGVGAALRTLGRFLDACEEHQATTDVTLAEPTRAGDELVAEVGLTVDLCGGEATSPAFDSTTASVDDDGTLTVSLATTSSVVPAPPDSIRLETRRTEVDADGTATVALRATVPTTEPATTAGDDTRDDVETGPEQTPGSEATPDGVTAAEPGPGHDRSRDVPPFRDRELLQEVYESCDTFAEMPDAIGMDVTAETVRRYMIRQGIHEPASYDTGDGGEAGDAAETADTADTTGTTTRSEPVDQAPPTDQPAQADHPTPTEQPTPAEQAVDRAGSDDLESPAVLADGIGLPDDVTIDTIVDAVRTSNTIYEVKREIGIEREDALEMLKELDLLEFVAGRLATEAKREVSRDEIIDRLRESATPA